MIYPLKDPNMGFAKKNNNYILYIYMTASHLVTHCPNIFLYTFTSGQFPLFSFKIQNKLMDYNSSKFKHRPSSLHSILSVTFISVFEGSALIHNKTV